MRISRSAVLVLLFLSMVVSASATSVINSNDWRNVFVSKNLADLEGEEIFIIASPHDAKVASHTVENPETLFTSASPTFGNFESRSGLNFSEKVKVSWKTYTNESEGYVVVKSRFGPDALAVLPYARRNNYSLVFYRDEIDEAMVTSEKPKLFYGDFSFDPEQRYPNTEYINGSWQDRNLELAEEIGGDHAMIAPREYADVEEVGSTPILFRMEHQRLAAYIDSSDIQLLEVIGPENMLYAKQIDVLTDKDLKIVVKTGRAFTGISDLQGVYSLKRIDMPYRRYNLDLAEVYRDNGTLALEFVNRGNTERVAEVEVNGQELQVNVPPFSLVRRITEVSESDELNISYSTQRSSSTLRYDSSLVSRAPVQPRTDLVIENLKYDGSRLSLTVSNEGERDVWIMVQADGKSNRTSLRQGDTAQISLRSVEEVQEYVLYQGRYDNQYTYSETYSTGYQAPEDIAMIVGAAFIVLIVLGGSFYVVREFTQ